jgi:hypothetical protein
MAILVAAGCAPREEGTVLARVGKTSLTLQQVMESLPDEYRSEITRDQIITYVKEWVDAELLYQDALRRNIEREPEVMRQLHAIKRDFLCAQQIHRRALDAGNAAATDSVVAAYYAARRPAWVRDRDVIKFAAIVLDDTKTAFTVRNMITRPTFFEIGERYSRDPLPEPAQAPYVSADKLPPCLAQVIFGIRIEGITAPILCEGRYYIVLVLDKQPKGTPASLQEARPEIVEALASQFQKRAREELVRSLRADSDVSLFLEQIPSASLPGADSVSVAIPDGANQ